MKLWLKWNYEIWAGNVFILTVELIFYVSSQDAENLFLKSNDLLTFFWGKLDFLLSRPFWFRYENTKNFEIIFT